VGWYDDMFMSLVSAGKTVRGSGNTYQKGMLKCLPEQGCSNWAELRLVILVGGGTKVTYQ